MTGGPAESPAWQRGTKCEGGACVEVAAQGDLVLMRSSQDPGTTVRISRDEWRAFLAGVKEGAFDPL